jgi:hypothetical protein
MNRQAVPSIFLSIANVCFFAVILYQRDPRATPTDDMPHATSDAIRPPQDLSSAVKLAGGAALASASPATEATPPMPATGGRPADAERKVAKAVLPSDATTRAGLRER